MKQTDSVIEGLRRLLYGAWAPVSVVPRYEHSDEPLFQQLWEVPASPDTYLSQSDDLARRWQAQWDAVPGEWPSAFYTLPSGKPEAFHPLCKFYRSVIHCEMRMIIALVDQWVAQLELTLLKYELLTLQQGLISLLVECDRRRDVTVDTGGDLSGKLESYLVQLLHNKLLMLLLELGDRYGHLLEDRSITLEKIYLKWLHRPEPRQHDWYHAEAYYEFYLEQCLRGSGQLAEIETLLVTAYSDSHQFDGQAATNHVKRSVARLENVFLCYVLGVETEHIEAHELMDVEENRHHISDWLAMLEDQKKKEESFSIHHLLRRLGYLKEKISVSASNSEAGQLLQAVGRIFEPSGGSGAFAEGSSVMVKESANPKAGNHWALQEYISMDEVRDKLSVHPDTLKRYLNESDAVVIAFSQKNKWMHQDDFHDFMQNHIED